MLEVVLVDQLVFYELVALAVAEMLHILFQQLPELIILEVGVVAAQGQTVVLG
jgi:hypothetical protein